MSGKKEGIKTYIEQTKLLVTLASAFIIPPAVLFGFLPLIETSKLIWTESLFLLSTIMGYVVLGTITGSQVNKTNNPYRPATRFFSLIQFFSYVIGIIMFITMVSNISSINKKEVNEKEDVIINIDFKPENNKLTFNSDSIKDKNIIVIINSKDTIQIQ